MNLVAKILNKILFYYLNILGHLAAMSALSGYGG
jgi:hypothetical protein